MAIIIGWILYLVEYPQNPEFQSVLDTASFAIITMSTVGYGSDYIPITVLGKIITIWAVVFGIICMSLPIPFVAVAWQRLYIMELPDFQGPIGKFYEPKDLSNSNSINEEEKEETQKEKLKQRNKVYDYMYMSLIP